MHELSKADTLDITFFVPCMNEEQFVVSTIETILAAVRKTGVSCEILVFDDHSSDGTVKMVEQYQIEHPELPITLVKKNVHRGLSRNYIEGAGIAKGQYYYIVGGDDDVPVEYIVTILEKLNSADVIIPSFSADRRRILRVMISKIYTKIVNLLSGYSLKYYNGAVHLTSNVLRYPTSSTGNGFLAELLVRVLNQGASYVEVSAPMRDKKSKVFSSTLSLRNIITVTHSLMIIFLLRINKRIKF